mmetsp:Transcript_91969/g.260373  ORF Transcript_91969/g.260373 Transcript_91969/m.260373 type:complete len:161 (-) Transcript_91969:950-1432(-)
MGKMWWRMLLEQGVKRDLLVLPTWNSQLIVRANGQLSGMQLSQVLSLQRGMAAGQILNVLSRVQGQRARGSTPHFATLGSLGRQSAKQATRATVPVRRFCPSLDWWPSRKVWACHHRAGQVQPTSALELLTCLLHQTVRCQLWRCQQHNPRHARGGDPGT